MIKCVQAVVRGRVQGVFFRACTEEEALRLGLAGWVRNLPDGAVEALIQGEAGRVDEMMRWLAKGSPRAVVAAVEVAERTPDAGITNFSIRY